MRAFTIDKDLGGHNIISWNHDEFEVGYHCLSDEIKIGKKEGTIEPNAMKRVAAGAHLSTSWLYERARRPDKRTGYCQS